MWLICPECTKTGGCDCPKSSGGRFRVRDHDKELEKHLEDIKGEVTPKYKPKK